VKLEEKNNLSGGWMKNRGLFVTPVILIVSLLFGCSPMGETVAKKNRLQSVPAVESPESFDSKSSNVESYLASSDRLIIQSYGPTIKKYAQQYDFDWRLILAMMKVESRFSIAAESHKGATGLMQIMPITSQEVGRVLEIEDIRHPKSNIHAGVYYFRRLYNLFGSSDEGDRIRIALAAYNAGMGRVYDAQELAAYLLEDPTKWESIRSALPLLSKRYYTLHRNVWEEEKPKVAGWFGNSGQTVKYVDKVMGYYEEYKLLLN
jgi:membrane-bound lytic murein transglycosylase MltF